MSAEEETADDLDRLVSEWNTHLVCPSPSTRNPHDGGSDGASVNVLHLLRDSLGARDVARRAVCDATYFARVCNASSSTSAAGTGAPRLDSSVSAEDESSAEALWLLSLVCHNKELMAATTQLTIQFQEQYAVLCQGHNERVDALRAHHAAQLVTLLDAPASTTSLIVDSSVTELFVMRHADELKKLRHECRDEARSLERSQQDDLRAFLRISAPDAIARLQRTGARSPERRERYQPEVDISRFAEQDATRASRLPTKPTPGKVGQGATEEADGRQRPEALGRPPVAPVRTIRLPNPLARDRLGRASARASPTRARDAVHSTTTADTRGARERSPNVAMPPIVLDVSPSSWLPRCLTSCNTRTHPNDPSDQPLPLPRAVDRDASPTASPPLSTTTAAISEHLLRLAHTRTSMLLLVATEAAASVALTSVPAPELFLTDSTSSGALHSAADLDEDAEAHVSLFTPLAQHPHLKVLFSTRLWGANIALLYTPPSFLSRDESDNEADGRVASSQDVSAKLQESAFDTIPPVVEDALRLAVSWHVDMFSVAVLDSKPTVRHDFTPRRGLARPAALTARAPDRSPAHGVAAQVLAQLQRGLAEMIFETPQFKSSYLWSAQEEELLASRAGAAVDGTRPIPRTVGTRYTGAGVRETQTATKTGLAKLGEFSPMGASPPSAPSSPNSPGARSAGGLSMTLPKASATFNTPMAIRVFLPLPEAFFSLPEAAAEDGAVPGAPAGMPNTAGPGRRGGKTSRTPGKASALPGEPQRGGSAHVAETQRGFDLDGRSGGHQDRLHYHPSTLGPDVAANPDDANPTSDAGLKAFVYYACGESASVL